MRLAWLIALLAMSACMIPRGPDSIESRCAQGFALLEAQSCQGDMRARNPAFTRYQLEAFQRECRDPESVARAEKIKTTCIATQETAVTEVKNDRRAIRAKYVSEVSELLVDPDYGPLADRYRESPSELTLAPLRALARRHGIDTRYAQELELWSDR